jgi:tetratricopeptide (TPR) repeat protein
MFLLFGILILVVGGLMMWVAGMSLDPFYLPLDIFLLAALLFLMVLTGLNFFFRNLEIRYNVRESQKYLMARNSQRNGLGIIIVCIFVGVIVILPFVAQSANKILSTDARDAVSGLGDRFVKHFDNQDRLGLFKSEWVDFELINGRVSLQLCGKADLQIDDICDYPLVDRTVDQGEDVRIPIPEEGYEQLALVVTNGPLGPSSFDFHIERNPAPVFISIQPLLICIVFIIMNSIWIVYLRPIRRSYATSSVYSEDYVAALGAESHTTLERPTSAEPAPAAKAIPTPKRKAPAPPIADDALPPPPLPGTAHPMPQGAFLNELILLSNSEGDKKQTMSLLRTIIELDPVNKEALFHLGDLYQEDGNYKFAYNEFDRITKIDPRDDDAFVKRGEVLMPLHREFDAVKSFRRALEVNPDNASAAEWLHSIKRENQKLMAQAIDRSTNKDFKGAIELYDKILARDPDNVQALLGKGTMYRRLEKWPASLESLNRVLELDPDNVAAIRNKVDVFESVMSWDEALVCYDEIIERSPDNYLDWVRRGDVLFELAKNEEAMESYKKAEELKPDSERVQKRIRLLTTPSMEDTVKEFTQIPGIGESTAITLFEGGFQSMEELQKASITKLSKVKGIGKKTAKKIKTFFEA